MTTGKVLVIDDEQMIRWSIEQTLRAAGHHVALAETAAEGMALFREFQPDIVFLDLRLPDGDGRAVLKDMANARGRKTVVIVMTAFGDSRTAAEVADLGAYAYLSKPLDFEQIERTVAVALSHGAAGVQQSANNKSDRRTA